MHILLVSITIDVTWVCVWLKKTRYCRCSVRRNEENSKHVNKRKDTESYAYIYICAMDIEIIYKWVLKYWRPRWYSG